MGLLINPYALIHGRLRPFAMPCSLVLRVSAGRIYCPFISVFLSLGSKVCCYARLWLTSGVEIPYYFNRPSDSYIHIYTHIMFIEFSSGLASSSKIKARLHALLAYYPIPDKMN